MKPKVIIVDDEETIRKLLKSRLDRECCDVSVAANAEEAQKAFKAGEEIGVMVTDLKMPGMDGFGLMAWVKQSYEHVKTIVITGHGEKEVAIRALREGASNYLEKPFDLDELSHSVQRCLKEYQLERSNHELVSLLEARIERIEGNSEDRYWYVSKDQSMEKVNEWLTVLRRESMRGEAEEPSVLILGSSGTGKEGIARMIHAGSRRGKGAWVAVNCANFNEQLLESELFGHERGAFTGANTLKRGLFEIAKNGTIFLDEIGEMDTKLQAKLLRVLQEKTFRRVGGTIDTPTDVRVIAATNTNVLEAVNNGRFREDLYHRLNRVVIEIPPLHVRKDDIVPMAIQFAMRGFKARCKEFKGFTTEAEAALKEYDWPGNVRELINLIERVALIYEGSGQVGVANLSLPVQTSGRAFNVPLKVVPSPYSAPDNPEEGYMGLKKRWTENFEREYLIGTLSRHGGNVSAAAREAKLDRSNFLRLLRRYTLRAQEYRKAA